MNAPLQLLVLMMTLLHLSTAVAASPLGSCVIGNYNLSVIPKSVLMTKEEIVGGNGTTDVSWSILPCHSNIGYIERFVTFTNKTVHMNLTDGSLSNGEVLLTFTNANASSLMSLTLLCGDLVELTWPSSNHTVEGNISPDHQSFHASLLTSVVCSASSRSSQTCGHGCSFLILVFLSLAVYVGGTVLWYYFVEGKRGLDLIPHREFWADFPFLVKDGAVYVYRKMIGLFGCGTRAATYESVY